MSRLKELLRELLDEEEREEVISDTSDGEGVNRILDADRTPAHSDTPPGQIVTEYGINNKIRAHANRQRFVAANRIKARTR